MNRNSYIAFFFFCCLLSGCNKEPDCQQISSLRTVLVYLGVDNNFSNEAEEKIELLKNNWDKSIDGNLLVYADAGEKPVLVHIHYTRKRGVVADTIEKYVAENSASSAVFARVLNKVKTYRPAASYGLVVLSHGSGWLPAEMSMPNIKLKSIILDTGVSKDNYMEIADFAEAIPYKLDFIIFDACFMGSVEVAYELKDKADYIVTSPAEVLAPGFVYSTMMRHLFKRQSDLTAVAREFYEYYDNQSGFHRSATVSVVKTSEFDALISVFKEITTEANLLPEDLNSIQTFGFGSQKIYFDMGDYLQKITSEKQKEIEAAFDLCVLYKACTPSYYSAATNRLHDINAFSGLSIYIPQVAYPEANHSYGNLKWTNAAGNVIPISKK
jgi:hypothetical protein